MASKGEETALGTARGRFIESLPRKAIELRGAIALLTATPAAEGPREDMRRRLHTLYASALVFRNDGLALAVKEGIDRLDAARDAARALSSEDLDVLTLLVKRIPDLRGDETRESLVPGSMAPPATGSSPPVAMSGRISSVPPREARTLLGIQPVPSGVTADRPSELPGAIGTREPSVVSTARGLGPSGGFGNDTSGNTRTRSMPRDGSRVPVLSRVLQVLVLSPLPVDTELQTAVATPSLSVSLVHTVRNALEMARGHAPDVIIADASLAQQGVLIGSLRGDPLTDFVPVVLLESLSPRLDVEEARAMGADDVITRPFQSPRLVRTLGRVTGTLIEGGSQLALPPTATLDELSSHVAEEIRRGIVEAAETGRDLRVSLGEGAEVLAAAWAAVARVRAFVTQQTAGKVKFSDRALRAGASFLMLGQDAGPSEASETNGEKALLGRRILVVDDDTAVVWFFAGVLREEGATVLEATDGKDALAKARSERPDVIISDILMPGLDGFALCRELKRDPALADVPVILLSWKEDLIARMRELSAGASGYLRKEAGATQIVAAVREVLRPRAELEAQLRAAGEVRGNLEGTGVVALLRSVRRVRPDARITLRDAFNHFECELREGRMAQLTRTASDGSFTRGERALPQLVGVSAGRFAVSDAEGPLKHAFEGTLDEVLTRGSRELGALLEALSPRFASRVARVVLDEDAYVATLKLATEGVKKVVERLHNGESPAQLLARDPNAAGLLESLLMELARRGAIRGVVGTGGEDLVAEARERRGKESPTLLHSPQSIIPPAPNPVISVLRSADERDDEEPETVVAKSEPPPVQKSEPPVAQKSEPPRAEVPPHEPTPRSEPTAKTDTTQTGGFEPVAETTPLGQESHALPVEPRSDDEIPTGQFDPVTRERADAALDATPPAQPNDEPEPTERMSGELPLPPAKDREVRDSVSAEPDMLESDERRSKSTMAGWALALLVLLGVGFFVGRQQTDANPEVEALGKQAQPPAGDKAAAAPEAAGQAAAATPAVAPLPQGDGAVVPRDSGFEIYDGIRDAKVPVAAGQALLVVEATPRLAGAELRVDGTKVGALPAQIALGEGVHELAIERGDAVTYRFASVRPGKTWVLREP